MEGVAKQWAISNWTCKAQKKTAKRAKIAKEGGKEAKAKQIKIMLTIKIKR